jgi:hypothetical protein
VSRLRDNPTDFEGAVTAAADSLGLAPLFVEKDYWVTQMLRSLHERCPGAFVLKGGTSLSKGYGLIERFSEDVDILMLPAKGDSAASRERLLARIADQVAGRSRRRATGRPRAGTRKRGTPRGRDELPTPYPLKRRCADRGPRRAA